ncbi:hypothetical protein ACFJIV_28910 [Mucilaginibacter sp. UC70_90]
MLYETLLSVPGMNESVKLNLSISRRQLLLLGQILDSGLSQPESSGLLSALPQDAGPALSELISDCLDKAGLTELNQKLKTFSQAQK